MRLGLFIHRLIFVEYAPFLEFVIPTECDTLQIGKLEGDMELSLVDEAADGGDFLKILVETEGPYTLTLSGPQAHPLNLQIPASGLVLYLVYHSGQKKYVAIASSSGGGGIILVDGSGTTIDGFAVDLGGTLNKPAVIETGDHPFEIKKGAAGIKMTNEATFASGVGLDNTPVFILRTPDNYLVYGGYFNTYKGVAQNTMMRISLDGIADMAFAANVGSGFDASGELYEGCIDSAGNIYVAGYFVSYNSFTANGIAKLNPNGSFNAVFAANVGVGPGADYDGYGLTVAVVPSGGIVLGGWWSAGWNGNAVLKHFVKLNADGTVDAAFHANAGTGPNNEVDKVFVQADGKIVVTGYFTSFNGVAANGIVRLNADGTRDGSFIIGVGLEPEPPTVIRQQADGKLILAGYEMSMNGSPYQSVLRLNTDGSYDGTFTGAGADSEVYDLSIGADGSLYIGASGDVYIGNGVTLNGYGPVKVDANNTPIAAFDPSYNSAATSLYYDAATNRLYTGGWFSQYGGTDTSASIGRLDGTTGANQASNVANKVTMGVYGTPLEYLDDQIPNLQPTSLPPKKYVDDEIAKLTGYNGVTRSGVQWKLGGILEEFTTLNTKAPLFMRSDVGMVSFSGEYMLKLNGKVWHAEKQVDGSLFVCGSFNTLNYISPESPGQSISKFGKLITSNYYVAPGAWQTLVIAGDNSQISGVYLDGTVFNFQVQADGKPVIIGRFTTVNGVSRRGIARLNTDGTLDATFDPGTGFDDPSYQADLAIQADGKIVVVGEFKAYNGTTAVRCARINTDGSIDAAFAANLGTGFVAPGFPTAAPLFRVLIQSADQKIIVAGGPTQLNGVGATKIFRLNTDGTHDLTYLGNIGFTIQGMAFQSTGKLVYSVEFGGRLGRLNADGSPDATFNIGTGFQYTNVPSWLMIQDVKVDAQDKIYVGGVFNKFNGTDQVGYARLLPDGAKDTSFINIVNQYASTSTDMPQQFDSPFSTKNLGPDEVLIAAPYWDTRETRGYVFLRDGYAYKYVVEVSHSILKYGHDYTDTILANPLHVPHRGYVDGRLLGFPLAPPGAGQNGQSLRWNGGIAAWEWYLPGSGGSGAPAYGTAGQIPFMDSSNSGFQYSGFKYDPTKKTLVLSSDATLDPTSTFAINFGSAGTTLNGSWAMTLAEESTIIGHDSFSIGWHHTVGDGVNGFSGTGTHTTGTDHRNYGESSYASGVGARVLWGANRGGFVHAFNIASVDGLKPATVPFLTGVAGSFNVSRNTPAQTEGHGTLSVDSAILGGVDHNIPADSPRSVILGGDAIKARAADPDQAYVPNLNIVVPPPAGDTTMPVLVRDEVTGQIKTRVIGGNPGVLTDAASIALTQGKHTLTTARAAITFTIPYIGDYIVIEVILNVASTTFTFPAAALCVSQGVAIGNNTLPLSGSVGDRYMIAVQKMGASMYVVARNFGQ